MRGLEAGQGAQTASGSSSSVDWSRRLTGIVLLGVLYYVGARLGLTTSLVEDNVTPLWPPTGIAVAAFLLFGRSLWPGVAVAAFAVNLPISEGWLAAAGTAAGNTLTPVVAVLLLERVDFHRQLDRRQDALAIVFLGALGATVVSATIGSTALFLSDAIELDALRTAWLVWWTGDAMGILVVAPFLLALPLFRESDWSALKWVEMVVILAIAAGLAFWTALSDLQVLYLVIPVVGWASWRLQLRGAAPAALAVTLIVTRSAANGDGPFAGESLFEQMFKLQTFNLCVALTSFFLAALVTERNRTAAALEAATRELEGRVERRTAELSATAARLQEEMQEKSEAQQLLSQEEAKARREHEIASTLQHNLLPDRIPQVPSVALAARYVPATSDIQVGGDWYDVIPLPNGLIGLAIGDVAGHGLQAAATMGQLRMALRAYAVQDPSPVYVMNGVHRLVSQLPLPEMVTLIYLVFDPETGCLRFSNAGHPPPLVVAESGSSYLEAGLSPPLGVVPEPDFVEASVEVPAGATVLLYTDGLIERRRESLQVGLDRLAGQMLGQELTDVDALCDRLLANLMDPAHVPDDIAVVAMRPRSLVGTPLSVTVDAEPRRLADVRRTLRHWLRGYGVHPEDESEVLLACGEACANVVRHAYGTAPGHMQLDATIDGEALTLTVRDEGEWRAPIDLGGGWGLQLIRGVMESVDVESDETGTVLRMQRTVRRGRTS